jgi:cytochrome c peroxidase
MSHCRLSAVIAAPFILSLIPLSTLADGSSSLAPQNEIATATDANEIVRLGQSLFVDRHLSRDGTVSCATCHIPTRAFTDGRPHGIGLGAQRGTRNTPSLVNVASEQTLFWDGRVSGLEQQVRSPLFSSREQGLTDDAQLASIVRSSSDYVARFKKAFHTEAISADQVVSAIAAYERSLRSTASPFDRFLYGHHSTAMSPAAQRGLQLFRGRANCSTCHTIGDSSAALTDHQFHGSSTRLPDAVLNELPALTAAVLSARHEQDIRSLNALIASDERIAELGRFLSTMNPSDIGEFRTPSLRNVAVTAPYMHDGSVSTLEDAVDLELYSRSAAGAKPIALTVSERADLVEFLRALSD